MLVNAYFCHCDSGVHVKNCKVFRASIMILEFSSRCCLLDSDVNYPLVLQVEIMRIETARQMLERRLSTLESEREDISSLNNNYDNVW